MNSITRRNLVAGVALLAAFALLTVLVQLVDVRPAGQNGTNVGFATFNIWFHGLTGVHMRIYTITDWLRLVPIAISLGFTAMGAVQLVRRRSLLKVDPDILLLGVYYTAVSLLTLSGVSPWVEAAFAVVVGATVLCGLCEVATANLDKPILSRRLLLAGTVLSVICVAVFIATRQPYAGIVCFALLVTKSLMLSKHVR